MEREIFTSKLQIIIPDNPEKEGEWMNLSVGVESEIDNLYSFFNENSRIHWDSRCYPPELSEVYVDKIKMYNPIDLTSCLKGAFLYRMVKYMRGVPSSFLLNFGGDMVGRGEFEVSIDCSFTSITTNGLFAIFTSGNTERRGNHIKCRIPRSGTVTEIFSLKSESEISRLSDFDCYTTLRFASEINKCEDSIEIFTENVRSKINM